MYRVLEPQLMEDKAQALAYAETDFSAENQGFVNRFLETFPDFIRGHILDIGCGPADIPIRLSSALPLCRITGIDGAQVMIDLARAAVAEAGLSHRIALQCDRLQALTISPPADAVVSNSLLHHLPDPLHFWRALKQLAVPGAPVLVMDLARPNTQQDAKTIVARYAAHASPILRRDFYNSLLAAFTVDEVAQQLVQCELSHFVMTAVDDRHWNVSGQLK